MVIKPSNSMSMSGVSIQGNHYTAAIFCQSTISYITNSHHHRLVPWKCLPKQRNLNSAKVTYSQRMCEAISVVMWHLPPIGLSVAEPVLQGPFRLPFLFCILLAVHINSTRTGEINSHHQQSPIQLKGIHTTDAALCPEGVVCNTAITTSVRCSLRHDGSHL
jgi:hypothetical protein